MADYEVKKTPEFTATTRKLETTDRAHADLFNDLYQKLFDNDNYLKENKMDSTNGDIADTQVSEFAESSEALPVPMAGDKVKNLWGKMKKWQQDCLAKFGNYVLTSMITNQHLNDTNRIPTSALVYLMQQSITQLNSDLGVLNTKQVETANAINGKLSKSNNITHLSWDSKYNIPVLTVNNQNKLIPVTLDVTKQFITQIGIAYTDRWVLRINYWYNGAEHHATINVDHSD